MEEKETSQDVDFFSEIKLSEISQQRFPTTNIKKRLSLDKKFSLSPAQSYFKDFISDLEPETLNIIKTFPLETLIWLKYENASDITKEILYADEYKLAEMAGLSAKKAFWMTYESNAYFPNKESLNTEDQKVEYLRFIENKRKEEKKKITKLFREKDKIGNFYKQYNTIQESFRTLRGTFFQNVKEYLQKDNLEDLSCEDDEFSIINLKTFKKESEKDIKDSLTKNTQSIILKRKEAVEEKKVKQKKKAQTEADKKKYPLLFRKRTKKEIQKQKKLTETVTRKKKEKEK